MNIGPRKIGLGEPLYVIGECSINHNGSMFRAFQMIKAAKDAGCDACKFQTFKTAEFCRPDDPMYEHFERAEFPDHMWELLKAECVRVGIEFLSTPQNPRDLDVLLKTGIPAIKIGSDDARNLPMLRYCARDDVGLPIILSCGMANMLDIKFALGVVVANQAALMVCTSQYPCEPEECNLDRITTLRAELPGVPIGFSDHTGGHHAAIIAATLGACIFETHMTLDRGLPGPDHSWALLPDQLAEWVSAIRSTSIMMGDGKLELSRKEREQRVKYQRQAGNQLRGEG